jgi:hypothetical protein
VCRARARHFSLFPYDLIPRETRAPSPIREGTTPFGHGNPFVFFHPGLTNRRLQAGMITSPRGEVCRAKTRQGEVKTKIPQPTVIPQGYFIPEELG